MDSLSLYLHLPFCHHKCAYCDLNAYAGVNHLIPAYVAALTQEIQHIGHRLAVPIQTVYFGGGTPSIVPIALLSDLFSAIRACWIIAPDLEITLEANPDTLDEAYLTGLRELGVNRLSIGAQSAQPNELVLFQRTHTCAEVERSVELARAVGFTNISLDLIYGIPGQTLARWQDTLTRMLALSPDHFSLYALSYDFETPMRAWIQRGLLAEPADDVAAAMYEWAGEILAGAGYEQYEISSWGRQSACRHNLQYWHNLPYLGLGAGAHGYYNGYRYANIASPPAYIERMRVGGRQAYPFSPAVQSVIEVDRQTEMQETMLTGLRLLREGVADSAFRERFGVGLEEAFGKELTELQARDLVYWETGRVKITHSGRLISNWVFEKFV